MGMRLYLTVDRLDPVVDTTGVTIHSHLITPVLEPNCGPNPVYSRAIQERICWLREACEPGCFDVFLCQLCNGWVIINAIVFEFNHDVDAINFKLRWLD
jgi:hypothetical protein